MAAVPRSSQRLQAIANRPLVERARESLLRAIRDGRFPGGRLPPEEALAENLGVSRGTLRAALQSLSAEGLVSRRRRHGTYVNEHVLRSSMRLNRLVPFARMVEQAGYRASTDPQDARQSTATAYQATELEIADGDEILLVRRLLRADDTPVITVTDVVPVTRLIVAPDRIRAAETTFEFLEVNARTDVDYAISEVVPRVAGATEPAGLDLPRGTPFIELHEIHFNRDHERVALSVVCVVDQLVRLSMLRRGH
jgi:GntR family transcriptional regulator